MGTEAAPTGPPAAAPGGQLVRDVVRDVIAEVAPRERLIIDGLDDFSDARAVRRLASRRRRSDPLGFGPDEFVALVTPLVWIILDEIAARGAAATVDGAERGLKGLWRQVFRRRARRERLPSLDRGELERIHRRVLTELLEAGVEEDRATAAADAVLRRLLFGPPDDPEGPAGALEPEQR